MELLRIDFSGCSDRRIGEHGLAAGDLEQASGELRSIAGQLAESAGTGMACWRNLPHDPTRNEHVEAVTTLADQMRPATENIVVLGIGGSALGTSAVHAALRPLTWNLMPTGERDGPRLFVLDNVDPDLVGPVLREVRRSDPDFEHTVFNVVSKSGETAETAAQLMVVQSMVGSDVRVVATTDPAQGTLRELSERNGWITLPIPGGVGGRFSVLSPVGLFPAALCGIDINGLLDGAAAMDAACSSNDPETNPAARLAWTLVEMARRGRGNHVLMPYSNRLAPAADWYRQLWAESLGKRHALDGSEVFTGPTPIRALGATDQHSQVQLYREGPDDKVIGFVVVDQHDEAVPIPACEDVESLRYLGGHDLGDLLRAEQRATEYALVESKRPHYTINLPRLDAPSIGQFLWLWQVTTAFAGGLLGIDPHDQPAVETGKQATFGLMGREGYEEWAGKVDRALD